MTRRGFLLRRPTLLTLPAALTCALALSAQTIGLRPGQYETTAEMDMPGGFKMAPQKDTQCITPEDLKDFSKAFGDPDFAKTCKVSDYKVSGNRISFTTECREEGLEMKGTTEMTFTAETFAGLMTMKDNKGRVTRIKTSAKRIGECAK
jgi:hypothetical protein